MQTLDATQRKMIQQELEAAAKGIAQHHGLEVEFAGGSYSPIDYTIKMKFELPLSERPAPFAIGQRFGLPEDIVGKTFKYNTKIMTVTGLNPSRPKNAVALKDQNGKCFKCSVEQLKRFMGL